MKSPEYTLVSVLKNGNRAVACCPSPTSTKRWLQHPIGFSFFPPKDNLSEGRIDHSLDTEHRRILAVWKYSQEQYCGNNPIIGLEYWVFDNVNIGFYDVPWCIMQPLLIRE